MTSRKEQMQADLDAVNYELDRARGEAETANKRVSDYEREQQALQAAIDILNGTGPVIPQYVPPFNVGVKDQLERVLAGGIGNREAVKVDEQAEVPSVPGAVKLGDEWVVLEPGMKIGKNIYGEDVIVPEGTPDPKAFAPPPTKPVNHAIPMLPTFSGESFSSDPNDILF